MSTHDDIVRTIAVLEAVAADGTLLATLSQEQRIALCKAAGLVSRPDRWEARLRRSAFVKRERAKVSAQDRSARAATGIRDARRAAVFTAPAQMDGAPGAADAPELSAPRYCYVCKVEYRRLHAFYDAMCIACGDFNYAKRFQRAPLHGQVALITGARLKIGYQASLMMLRAGARVIATTRFPVDAAQRFAREADFAAWGDRLQVHGLDLRHAPSVELFARYIEQTTDRLDILINNAAQTVRRPPGFYAHLLDSEAAPFAALAPDVQRVLQPHAQCVAQLTARCDAPQLAAAPTAAAITASGAVDWRDAGPGVGLRASAQLSQIPYAYDQSLAVDDVFPRGALDADLQQVDLRAVNSWRLKLADVPAPEMLEVQLVNSVAPFILCSKLAPLMRRDHTGKKHIVNVTAMEGKFSRYLKTDKHPHTNMAKAALNMLTLTSAKDLAEDGIFMNAVDTGWVTDEDPAALAAMKQAAHDFQPPLDIVDGAARICDPFFDGINTGTHWCGQFLKDYKPTEW